MNKDKKKDEKVYTGKMQLDRETSEVITPEEAARRKKEKDEMGREQK